MKNLTTHLSSTPAPFYLIQFPFDKKVNHKLFWESLLSKTTENLARDPLSHPDILWLPLTEARYSKEDLASFQKFISLRPHENKRKICIWQDASGLSENLVNKLLKDLEDPGFAVTVLMGQTKRGKLPSTLSSRALMWRVQIESTDICTHLTSSKAIAEILEAFSQKELTPVSFAASHGNKKEIAQELWRYVLQNQQIKNPSDLFSLHSAFSRFEKGIQVNHLRKDHLLELGLLLQSMADS